MKYNWNSKVLGESSLHYITIIYFTWYVRYKELLERRAEVVGKLDEFETVIDPILTILVHPEVSKHLESSK